MLTLSQVKQSKGVFVSNQGDSWRLLAANGEAVVYFPLSRSFFAIDEVAGFINFGDRLFEQTKEKFKF